MATSETVLATLVNHKGIYLDEQDNVRKKATHVAVLNKRGEFRKLVLLIPNANFEVRELTVGNDGQVHLLKDPCGGEVEGLDNRLTTALSDYNINRKAKVIDAMVL